MASSTTEQIACVQRELKMRAAVYPKRVQDQRMTQAQADRELEVMGDILIRLKAAEARATPAPTAEPDGGDHAHNRR